MCLSVIMTRRTRTLYHWLSINSTYFWHTNVPSSFLKNKRTLIELSHTSYAILWKNSWVNFVNIYFNVQIQFFLEYAFQVYPIFIYLKSIAKVGQGFRALHKGIVNMKILLDIFASKSNTGLYGGPQGSVMGNMFCLDGWKYEFPFLISDIKYDRYDAAY